VESALIHHLPIMGVGMGAAPTWILKILAKKDVLLVSSGKKQSSPLLVPLEKFWKNPLVATPWKKSFRRPCCLVSPCDKNRHAFRPFSKPATSYKFFETLQPLFNLACSVIRLGLTHNFRQL